MLQQLSPFEYYILQVVSTRPRWYRQELMDWLFTQNPNHQANDFNIYTLKMKQMLNSYSDNNGDYFTINTLSNQVLQNSNSSLQNNNPIHQYTNDRPRNPTQEEIIFLEYNRQQENELRQKTIENLDIQKRKTRFDKIMSIISLLFAFASLLISILTALSSNYEIMYKIVKNTITNEKQSPVISPIKK